MNSYQKNNLYWILWGLFIFILISVPGDLLPDVPDFMSLFKPDKLVHVFVFMIFIFLMLRGFTHESSSSYLRNNAFFLALFITIFIGGFTEVFQQYFIPGRTFSFYDFIANTVGCFAGLWLFVILKKRKSAQH